ncbi:class I SAM-dependent methyltransferase [Neisseria sp. Ec49-e6-T10]|uniref:class I SAM-dependent methyltransferase n=1 Tax=Neisseria sp. Ec49-e6-T10 TaxID=3140744 RepID=UPI003EC0B756
MTTSDFYSIHDWFIFREIADRMDDRLRLLKTPPKTIIIMGTDGAQSVQKLVARYPKTKILEIDPEQSRLDASKTIAKTQQSFWQKLRQPYPQQRQQTFLQEVPEKPFDMLWSNLSLQKTKDLPSLFSHWASLLRPEGMLFASSLGSETLIQIRTLLSAHNIILTPEPFIDMHDMGDLLAQHGFSDPIVDMDKISLSYEQNKTFWQDMHLLGIWHLLGIQIEDQPLAKKVINDAIEQHTLSTITLEVIYAHAVKNNAQDGVSIVHFHPKKHH